MSTAMQTSHQPRRALLEVLPWLVTQVTHDLNNQLSRVLGKAELALMNGDSKKYRSALKEIQSAGQDSRILIADLQRLVGWSRSTEEAIALDDILALVSRLVERKCERAGIQLVLEPIETTAPPAHAAAVGILAWAICNLGLRQQQLEGQRWTLRGVGSNGSCGIMLEGLHPLWQAETQQALQRSLNGLQDPTEFDGLSGLPATLVTASQMIGCTTRVDDRTLHLELPS